MSTVVVFGYTLKKPKYIFSVLVGISFLTTSLIVGGSYPAFDEILLFGVTCALIVHLFRSKNLIENDFKRQLKNKTGVLFIVYLMLNTAISLFGDFQISNLRFILLYGCLFLIVLYIGKIPQDKSKIIPITSFCIRANLYVWVFYWIFLYLINVDWAAQQAKTWAGTTYAALIPSVGLLLLLLIENESNRKIPSLKYQVYFFTSVLASILYDSRVLSSATLLALIYLAFRKRSIKGISVLLALLVMGQVAGSLMVASNLSVNVSKIGGITNPLDQVGTLLDSAQFVYAPRPSDLDRSQQINCSTKLMFLESGLQNKIFGYGQNAHKDVMRRCLPEGDEALDSKILVRPVGYAAYIVDFGLFGVLLLMVLVLKSIQSAYKTKFGAEKAFLILWILSWSLITNDLDHLFIYIVLLLNFFGEFRAKSETMQK
jgi:hypothetical protein